MRLTEKEGFLGGMKGLGFGGSKPKVTCLRWRSRRGFVRTIDSLSVFD